MITNGFITALGPVVVPPPEGVNVEDFESLAENIGRFEP